MEESRFQLAQGDAVAWLRTLPASSVDLAITDPPYESLEKHRAIGTTTRLKHSKASSNDWFSIFPNARFPELFAEVYRVLKKDTHFYLFCDPETMFVAKPLAEAAGFKFWKPLIWDKCLDPDTPVWTERGVMRIADLRAGDRVAIPEGGLTTVAAVRMTRAPAVRLSLSDGSDLVASLEHRFMRGDGRLVEAQALDPGDALCTRPVRCKSLPALRLDDVIPEDEAVHELPDTNACLWCGERFESSRAAAAHQGRWCEASQSKAAMAERLGIAPKRLRRWMLQGRMPRAWARSLGLEDKLGSRIQCQLQNDLEVWYPRELPLDYALGKIIGLYAAEGSRGSCGVTFALHAHEKHLQAEIARFARSLGIHANVAIDGNKAVVHVSFKIMNHVIDHFVGGDDARTKYFKAAVYATPDEFRRGVLAGLVEGDGHWSHAEQRQTYTSASLDLAMFVNREVETRGGGPSIRWAPNDGAGAWVVRFDPIKRNERLTVVSVEQVGVRDLVDISVTDRDELFVLANGVVTHNCKIGMGYHYRARYECVLFFEKGKRKLADLGTADIIEVPRVIGGYPAEKPPEVSEVLVRQSSDPGQLVIDPFMGSGSVGVAAIRNRRAFAGNDLCTEAIAIARERLVGVGGIERREVPASEEAQLGLVL